MPIHEHRLEVVAYDSHWPAAFEVRVQGRPKARRGLEDAAQRRRRDEL